MTPSPPQLPFRDVGSHPGSPRYRRATDESVEVSPRDTTGEWDLYVDGRQVGSFMHGPPGRLLSEAAPGQLIDRMLAAVRGEA